MQYASFTALPGVAALGGGPAAASGGFALPAHLRPEADEAVDLAAPAAVLDLAQKVLEEHNRWSAAHSAKEAARRERQELMRVVLGSGGARDAADAPSSVSQTSTSAQDAPSSVAQDAGPARVAASTPPQPSPLGEPSLVPGSVTLDFHLPGARREVSPLDLSSGGFDIYSKAYQLLQDKDRAFTMELSGPRNRPGPPMLFKRLDEGTWSFNLAGLGLEAGCTYDVQVAQP